MAPHVVHAAKVELKHATSGPPQPFGHLTAQPRPAINRTSSIHGIGPWFVCSCHDGSPVTPPTGGAMALDDRLRDDARELTPYLVNLRHRLHQHPEIGLDLPVTQRTVLAELDGLGLEVSTGAA